MHVHSYFSGPCTTPVVGAFCRESYSDPEEVLETLQRREMNLFTLTDHDSIEGSEKLRRHPHFFLSEELTCRMPSGTEVHIGVYDFHERQHVQLQQRRNDLPALLMYLTERQLFFSINHVFSSLTGRRELEDFGWFEEYFPAMETRNGQMLAKANAQAARLARRWRKTGIGGSDGHALASVGKTYTHVAGAVTKQQFFDGLREGRGRVHGESGCVAKLTRDVFLIAGEMMREKWWTMLLAPLAVALPVATYLNYRDEGAFLRRWSAEVMDQGNRDRVRWASVPNPAVEEWA
ncbi:MAG TPA: PHP domain-containing protein [Candidatus Dormibacteraeota bacterium]|nr:PHP domain-containing protein [Candidatus Dormibacteraeota bacterium]